VSDAQRPRIEEAWRQATDFDVADALNSLDHYADEAVDIIKAEAHRRGIKAEDAPRVAPPRTYAALRKTLGPTVRFFARHRLLAAALFGVVTQSILTQISPAVSWPGVIARMAILLPIYWFCLGALCWPLRRYRLVIAATAVWVISATATGVAIGLALAGYFGSPPSLSMTIVAGLLGATVMRWVATGLPLCGVVWWRNRYRPVFPPGHCAKCGYNLRGLPEPRCPECGTPFDPRQHKNPEPGEAP
jgi:hypothetical protein